MFAVLDQIALINVIIGHGSGTVGWKKLEIFIETVFRETSEKSLSFDSGF